MNVPVINIKATGENIDRMRSAADFTVKDIQQACGLSTPMAVYKWLYGWNLPTIDNMVILASLLNTTVDDILVVE